MQITKENYADERKTFSRILKERPDLLGHYVYALVDPTKESGEQVFYVGKGQGMRMFAHVAEAFLDREVSPEKDASEKISRIRAIHSKGQRVGIRILHYGLTTEHAFIVESVMIDVFSNFKSIDTESIGDMTNAVGGFDCRHGFCSVETLAELQSAHGEVVIKNGEKVLAIKINGTATDDAGIYNRVRQAWRLNPDRADQVDYIAACRQGMVVGLYENKSGWYQVSESDGVRRYAFDGVPVSDPEVLGRYINRLLPAQRRGAQNPIKYLPK